MQWILTSQKKQNEVQEQVCPVTRLSHLFSSPVSWLLSTGFSQPSKSWACWCCIPMSKACRQPMFYAACVNGRAAFPLKKYKIHYFILKQWGNNHAMFLYVCVLRVSGRAPWDGTTPLTGVLFLPHLYQPIALYFLPLISLSLLPSSLHLPFPPTNTLFPPELTCFFFRSTEPSHHHHHLHPPVLPLGLPRSTSCATCRPGESGVEERQERGGFQPSEEREERRTGKRGTMAAPSVALKTWVILQTLCLALAQVVSAQWRMRCALLQGMWGDEGPQVRWGDRGFSVDVSRKCKMLWGPVTEIRGVKPTILFHVGTSTESEIVLFFCCGDAIKSGQSGGF